MITKYYVYIHYRKDNLQPFYVGKGSGRRIDSKKSRNQHWKRIVEKYGLFTQIMESNLTEEQAFEREKFYISVLGRENLCNYTDGGDGSSGYKFTKEQSLNLSKAMKGKTSGRLGKEAWNKGKKMSDESKQKLSDSLKGHIPWNKGVSHLKGDKHINSKKIINTETGEIFSCIREAAELNNIPRTTLNSRLNGRLKNNTPFEYYNETPNIS